MQKHILKFSLLLLILGSFGLTHSVMAQLPTPVIHYMDSKTWFSEDSYIGIVFSCPGLSNYQGFKLFIKEGVTNTYDDFTEIADVSFSNGLDSTIYIEGDTCYASVPLQMRPGKFSFYLICYGNGVETNNSNIYTVEFDYDPWEDIWFTTFPDPYGKINQEWVWDIDAESIDGGTIKFELVYGPDGATLDQNSGLLEWTPQASGYFMFSVKCYLEDDESIFTQYDFYVMVQVCEVPSTVNLSIKYENGENVQWGYGVLFSQDSIPNQYYAKIIDGSAIFENVDAGTYYLLVEGDMMQSVFYENSFTIDEATPIVVECDETINLSMTVEEQELPEMRVIDGYVTNQIDGSPVPYAIVEFYSVNPNGRYDYFTAITNNDGYYRLDLYGGFEYIGRASAYSDSLITFNNLRSIYYDQKTDITEADYILLDTNKRIDFALAEYEELYTGLGGSVVDSENEPIAGAWVIAYCVEADENYKDYEMMGFTVMSDEEGNFEFRYLAPGDYVLLAFVPMGDYVPGYFKENDFASLSWQDATVISLTNNSQQTGKVIKMSTIDEVFGEGEIIGVVTSNSEKTIKSGEQVQGKKVVSGALVHLIDQKGTIIESKSTDTKGEFKFKNVPYGKYKLYADKIGYFNGEDFLELKEGFNLNIEIELSPKTTKVDDDYANYKLNVWPNPASEFVNIDFEGVAGTAEVRLTDALGASVQSMSINTVSGINSVKLNVKDAADGVYYVRITMGGKSVFIPIVLN